MDWLTCTQLKVRYNIVGNGENNKQPSLKFCFTPSNSLTLIDYSHVECKWLQILKRKIERWYYRYKLLIQQYITEYETPEIEKAREMLHTPCFCVIFYVNMEGSVKITSFQPHFNCRYYVDIFKAASTT